MIAVIRIKGRVKVEKDIKETLSRLRLRKKYACVILPNKKEIVGMVKKVENFVAYGEINSETLKKLIEKRGKIIDNKKKLKVEQKIIEEIENEKKKFQDFNIKPFFRLHPPRGGIKSKEKFPNGVLGYNGEKINKLIERML